MIKDTEEHHKSEQETFKNEVMEHRKELDINHPKMKSNIERTQESPHMIDNALREIGNEKKLLQNKKK